MLTAKVTYVKGMQFVGDTESGHAIVMDADPSDGGQNTAQDLWNFCLPAQEDAPEWT